MAARTRTRRPARNYRFTRAATTPIKMPVSLAAALTVVLGLFAAQASACPHGNHGPRADHSIGKRATACGKTAASKFFKANFTGGYDKISTAGCPGYDWSSGLAEPRPFDWRSPDPDLSPSLTFT